MAGTKKATWLSVAFGKIRRCPHLSDELYDVLRAFGRDDGDAPGPASLDPEAADADAAPASGPAVDAMSRLQNRIANELLAEVDADQASMFGRRFSSVSSLLNDGNVDTDPTTRRLLRLALHRRTVQILSTSDPVLSKRKALRVRALVDFIWSQSLVLGLRDTAANNPTLVELVHEHGLRSPSSPRYTEFSPGFYHHTIEGMSSNFGPVHINVLRIDLSNPSLRMKCVDARKTCTDLPTLAKRMGAVAAISGGFFLYSEPDIELPSVRTDPVGLMVSDGSIVGPPVFRRAAVLQNVGVDGDRKICLDKVGMEGIACIFLVRSANEKSPRRSLELIVGRDDVRCIHRGNVNETVVEENECVLSIVGSSVVAKEIASFPITVPVPLAGFLLVFPEGSLPKDTEIMSDDVTVNVTYELPCPHNKIENAMAGGPMFFSEDDAGCSSMDLPLEDFRGSAPPVTFSQDETHDHNLLPRMAVGIAKDLDGKGEQLVCVAVDGRNLDKALGLTLQGTADLLRSLGCTMAMNLDGGSSKRMVVWDPKSETHKVVCLSTTEIKANAGKAGGGGVNKTAAEPSRPVHSAILFLAGEKNSYW